MYIIDKDKRRIVISKEPMTLEEGTGFYQIPKEHIIVNEFDKINRNFIPGTQDTYECELVLLDVEIRDENNPEVHTGKYETKAFAKRIGYDNWLMEFNESEYKL